MKLLKGLSCIALAAATLLSLSVGACAADYTFGPVKNTDYYPSTTYEEQYGTAYHYSAPNLIDYQIPELPYGIFSTTQTGIMEKLLLPGLQQFVATSPGAIYGIEAGTTETPTLSVTPVYREPAYTSAEDLVRKDGSIGTLNIPALNISMKVWEGETDKSMDKGLGHYSTTSAWDGNIGLCGHNRGSKYAIGEIKDLELGDTITYTTIHGTRTYEVILVETISSTDWSYLQSSYDNRITLTTCLVNRPEKRICVQAVQVFD